MISHTFTRATKIHRTAGFTLIEVLVAMTVFTIGILAIITMQTTSTGGNARARIMTEAANQAAHRMEWLKTTDYDAADLTDANNDGLGGLGNRTCCFGNADPWGNAVAGCAAANRADRCATGGEDGSLAIYWNIANDQPLPNLKSVRVLVVHAGLLNPIEFNFNVKKP